MVSCVSASISLSDLMLPLESCWYTISFSMTPVSKNSLRMVSVSRLGSYALCASRVFTTLANFRQSRGQLAIWVSNMFFKTSFTIARSWGDGS